MSRFFPNQSDAQGSAAPSNGLSEVDLALLASTGYMMWASFHLFQMQLVDTLEGKELDARGLELLENKPFSSTSSPLNKMKEPLAQGVATIVWQESDFMPSKALQLIGHAKRFQDSGVTLNKNSIATEIYQNFPRAGGNGLDAIRRSVGRICDAMEILGLIERSAMHNNLKPICGTEALHDLMCASLSPVAEFYAKQLGGQDGRESA